MESRQKSYWEGIYQDKSALEVSWYQRQPVLSLQMIEACGLAPGEWIIDVGGGASSLVDHLLDLGYRHIMVLDIAEAALVQARQRLGARQDEVEWRVADVTDFKPTHNYNLWHDRAVFHFLTEARQRQAYIQTLRQAVPPGGHLILATFAIGGPEQCSGLPIVQYDAEQISALLGPDFELQQVESELHTTPGGGQQAFNFFRFRRLS